MVEEEGGGGGGGGGSVHNLSACLVCFCSQHSPIWNMNIGVQSFPICCKSSICLGIFWYAETFCCMFTHFDFPVSV